MTLTQRQLVASIIGGILIAFGVSLYSIKSILRVVDKGLQDSDTETLFSAIEAGPLEFARQYSGEFSDSQLKKLMEKSALYKRNFVKASITANGDNPIHYASWAMPGVDGKCIKETERQYKFPDGFFSFSVKIGYNNCSKYLVTESFASRIVLVFSLAVAFTLLSGFFGLILLVKSTSTATTILTRYSEKESDLNLESIRYLPIRNLANLAIESIRMQKFKTLAQMAQMIGHDLRAPLSSIERLLHSDQSLPLSSLNETIRESIGRIYSMIESIRHADTEILIEPAVCILSIPGDLASLEGKAEDREISMSCSVAPTPKVRIDKMKFERAWINLVSNAIDFAKSQIKIDLETVGKELLLRVTDDGPGVPDDFLPKLFQRGATQGKADGTGLGLAYVRQIMRGHGGDITYRRENDLTIFECRLPNAVESEMVEVFESTAVYPMNREHNQMKKVAICLEPEPLSASVLAKLTSLNSDDFFFTCERSEADIVVSNIEDVMFETLERDDQEFLSAKLLGSDETWIVDLLKRKFNLG